MEDINKEIAAAFRWNSMKQQYSKMQLYSKMRLYQIKRIMLSAR